MVLSTNFDFIRRIYGEEEAVKVIADAGFDAIDYSLGTLASPYGTWLEADYREQAKRLLDLAHSKGVYFNQAHAPIPITASGQNTADALKNVSLEKMERVFEVCSLLKIPHVIVHGMRPPFLATQPEKMFEFNLAYFRSLKEVAAPHGVRIAVENLYKTLSSPENLGSFMDQLNDDFFMACIDVGHCNMVNNGSAGMIRRLGRHVQALHVHDNHVDYDEHMIPGMGTADWDEILTALAEVKYPGDFTLELDDHVTSCMRNNAGFDREFFPTVLKFARQSGRYLADRLAARL